VFELRYKYEDMIFLITRKVHSRFDQNLRDWFLGGPKEGGWTRFGPSFDYKECTIVGYKFDYVDVDEALAKNKEETLRWHINFLKGNKTYYKKEYLETRYDEETQKNRIETFESIFLDIKKNGIIKRIWVADVSCLDLGFKYFRFDGCHRLCCAKVLGIKKVPSIIFQTTSNI